MILLHVHVIPQTDLYKELLYLSPHYKSLSILYMLTKFIDQ